MPSDERMMEVTAAIEAVQAATFRVRLGENEVETDWLGLNSATQDSLLATAVDWEGFTPEERGDVVRRVIEGEPPERWMDDIVLERQLLEFDAMAELERMFAAIAVPPDFRVDPDIPAPTFRDKGMKP